MGATMKRKKLVRDVKREALSRMEDSARTDDDLSVLLLNGIILTRTANARKETMK